MTTVQHRHIQGLGYCNRGSREWFARQGLSWPIFLREGIPAVELERTGDAMALRAVAAARTEEGSSDGK
jgi:hypothetical protein